MAPGLGFGVGGPGFGGPGFGGPWTKVSPQQNILKQGYLGFAEGQGFGVVPGFVAAQEFAGGGAPHRIRPGAIEKEELVGVNECVWQLLEEEQGKTRQRQQPFTGSTKKPKTSKAIGLMFSGEEPSDLEVFLDHPRIGFAETLFDSRVVQHVIKTYPGFYTKYPTVKAVNEAVDKYKPAWRLWSSR